MLRARLLISMLMLAATLFASAARADYSGHPRAAELLKKLEERYGFTPAELDGVRATLADAQRLPQLIAAEKTAAERTLTWTRYRPLHITDAQIDNGVRFLRENAQWLARAEAEYGVSPYVITAILGVETRYGIHAGRHRTLDALATQGFEHPRRSDYFFGELTQFFVLCRDQGLDPTEIRGSYAGAISYAQFMPGNYRWLGVDFDGDGRVNLWTVPDAIGSVANYLVRFRPEVAWRRGEPVTLPLRRFKVRGDRAHFNRRRPDTTLAQLAKLGAVPMRKAPGHLRAGLLKLPRDRGQEYWIALTNFYSIMSYNPSVFYAMAVAQLAEEIAQADAATPAPVGELSAVDRTPRGDP
jgi:membrane-bound lytic murein transglycosylase B